MTSAFVAWAISAVVLLAIAVALGLVVRRNLLGILIDGRGRYSLTQFQLVAWSIVVLSLISAFFWARLLDDEADALSYSIPNEVLLLLGISIGSAGVATAIKSAKDQMTPERIAASDEHDKPRLSQLFLVEEGAAADQTIDVGKYQNFWFTVILLVAYVALAIDKIETGALGALPTFSGTFVTLLGISHAGYLAGKLPNRPGIPPGLTVELREAGAVPGAAPGLAVAAAPTYVPRNPAD